MSRAAYEAHFGQPAPPGAVFGVDVSWWQAAANNRPSYSVCADHWADYGTWADFVCVRVSFGGGGDDGAQDLHFQVAAERGYTGAMGTYHFVSATSSAAANAANYLSRSDPFLGRTTFDMLDFEASPIASAAYINELCDRVEQARQRTCFIYSGYSYLNAAGGISCPAGKFWIAHYAASGSNAWVPTTNPASWDAPIMPRQYGGQYPGIWQWSSLTPQHGSLDLNISTTPEAFGGSFGISSAPPTPKEDAMLVRDKVSGQIFAVGDGGKRYIGGPEATAWAAAGLPLIDMDPIDVESIPNAPAWPFVRDPRSGTVYEVGDSGKRPLSGPEFTRIWNRANSGLLDDAAVCDSIPNSTPIVTPAHLQQMAEALKSPAEVKTVIDVPGSLAQASDLQLAAEIVRRTSAPKDAESVQAEAVAEEPAA